ncbi:lantibiotic ABC transporter permease [Aerococcaceae bacterium zg-ZJ1578]|uniref:lantibiotic ABC transporter permease n=1 Tax=Aerococcaceae bacterium zg-252 TaxID=2796928 RepID=UPI001A325EE0|nr:lantibiotic ABC transporter permease [Aerococcaceae bacterium zg-1578]
MLKILFKKNISYQKIILSIVLLIVVHLSGKFLLGVDFADSVLNYYFIQYRNFYIIGKYLVPIITFLYFFVFSIDLTEDYMVLVVIRNNNEYRHILDISLYVFLTGIIYWGLYFLIFQCVADSRYIGILREMIRTIVIVSQVSSMYFLMVRVIRNVQIAVSIVSMILVFLSFQSSHLVDVVTLSPISIFFVVVNIFVIVVYISKIGVVI